jgi:hypothetical protein
MVTGSRDWCEIVVCDLILSQENRERASHEMWATSPAPIVSHFSQPGQPLLEALGEHKLPSARYQRVSPHARLTFQEMDAASTRRATTNLKRWSFHPTSR